MAQPPPTTPGSVTGLFRVPWVVTDRVEIPPAAVSGYYEAKLEIGGGAHAGAVGSVPLAPPPRAVCWARAQAAARYAAARCRTADR